MRRIQEAIPLRRVREMLAAGSGLHFGPAVWRAADSISDDLVATNAAFADAVHVKAAA
ncbi:MAG: hypothetical protein WC718_12945 [Phycisphaerales bacterium]